MRKIKKASIFLMIFLLPTMWAFAGNPELKLVFVKDPAKKGSPLNENNMKEINFTIFGLKNQAEANALADKFWVEDKNLKGLMQTFTINENPADGSYKVQTQFLKVATKKYILELAFSCGFEKVTIDGVEVNTREMIQKS
ncbi:MAG: hypothetical protein V2A54_17360 [Bacteroidota bacterium]